jgi:aspartate aminotransferase
LRSPDAPAWATWLEPQERFDARRAEARRRGGARFVDLAYANAWGGPSEEVREVLARTVRDARSLDLQYTPYAGNRIARRVTADLLSGTTGQTFSLRDVAITAGAMGALYLAFASFEPGEIAMPAPTWMDHPLYAARAGHTPVLVPNRPNLRLDFDAIEHALTERTRAFVLTQPGNPCGHTHSAAELATLASLLRPRGIWLVSDECHRDHPGAHPIVSPALPYERTIVVGSFGKRLMTQGLRIGFVAVSPEANPPTSSATNSDHAPCLQELVRCGRAGGYGMASALLQRALPDLLAIDPGPARAAIARRRARAVERLSGRPLGGDATMFLYVQVGDSEALVDRLAAKGVLVLPASVFHHEGWVRISCSATDDMLERGVDALVNET